MERERERERERPLGRAGAKQTPTMGWEPTDRAGAGGRADGAGAVSFCGRDTDFAAALLYEKERKKERGAKRTTQTNFQHCTGDREGKKKRIAPRI